jgi:tetratricopeptide (TPR) repeat protein
VGRRTAAPVQRPNRERCSHTATNNAQSEPCIPSPQGRGRLARTGKGNTLDALGEYEDALEAYAWRNRADLLYDDLKRFDDARRAAEQAVSLEPDNARGWMLKGLALRAGGHEAEAREAFMTAVTKNQADFFGWYSHGVAWFELGQYGNALQAIDAALKLNDGDKDAWALRAKALRALGRIGEAQRAQQRAKTSKDRM